MNKNIFVICVLFTGLIFSQKDSLIIGDKYLEDQLYISLTYNSLRAQPSIVNSSGLSYGLSSGFIRDIPFNKNRNFGIGVGLGYGFDFFNHGLIVSEDNNEIIYRVDNTITSNKFFSHNLELPFEIRWRNSTKRKYSFWRIYTGIKLSYNFSNKFEYTNTEGTFTFKNISSFNKWQTGFIISAGYDAFNFHLYYGLNSIYKGAIIDGNPINTKVIKFGLTFYIL